MDTSHISFQVVQCEAHLEPQYLLTPLGDDQVFFPGAALQEANAVHRPRGARDSYDNSHDPAMGVRENSTPRKTTPPRIEFA